MQQRQKWKVPNSTLKLGDSETMNLTLVTMNLYPPEYLSSGYARLFLVIWYTIELMALNQTERNRWNYFLIFARFDSERLSL